MNFGEKKKSNAYGGFLLTELNVKPIKWATLYLLIRRLQWQISRFYFTLQIKLNQQADSQLAATVSAGAGRRASKSLTSFLYEVPFPLENISPMRIFLSFQSLTFQATSLKSSYFKQRFPAPKQPPVISNVISYEEWQQMMPKATCYRSRRQISWLNKQDTCFI